MPRYLTLQEARKRLGLSQAQLEAATAKLAAEQPTVYVMVHQRNISKIENGLTDDPRNRTVLTLEAALSVKRGTLVFGQREALAS